MDKKDLQEVKKQIEEFRNLFKDNPVKHIEEGTWFTIVLQMVLNETPQKLDAKFFKKKYIGLSNEQKAKQLVKATANYTAIAGGCAAGVVSAAEVSTVVTAGWSLTAAAVTLIGEISFITYLQLKLVYEISILLNAKLDREDPEDILILFWFALGINVWDDISNTVLKVGPRSTEYLGRKALRSGIRSGIQSMVTRIGGTRLARKITERALLKLIVPGINIPIAAIVNRTFTSKLGNKAIKKFKTRGAVISVIDNLLKMDRYYSILSIPLIYYVGIIDNKDNKDKKDKKGLNEVIEMQSNTTKKIFLTDDEDNLVDNILQLDFDEFCKLLDEIKGQPAADLLGDIAAYTSILKGNNNHSKLEKIIESLDVKDKINLGSYKGRLGN
ncbi:hypothetical protein ACIQX3_24865 [Peribacillus frigoritolerans]|uniref:hypothetical protein n=1 Tax=Peribacillus frigoritolerans TaxID=450367 RepID=UPI0038025463